MRLSCDWLHALGPSKRLLASSSTCSQASRLQPHTAAPTSSTATGRFSAPHADNHTAASAHSTPQIPVGTATLSASHADNHTGASAQSTPQLPAGTATLTVPHANGYAAASGPAHSTPQIPAAIATLSVPHANGYAAASAHPAPQPSAVTATPCAAHDLDQGSAPVKRAPALSVVPQLTAATATAADAELPCNSQSPLAQRARVAQACSHASPLVRKQLCGMPPCAVRAASSSAPAVSAEAEAPCSSSAPVDFRLQLATAISAELKRKRDAALGDHACGDERPSCRILPIAETVPPPSNWRVCMSMRVVSGCTSEAPNLRKAHAPLHQFAIGVPRSNTPIASPLWLCTKRHRSVILWRRTLPSLRLRTLASVLSGMRPQILCCRSGQMSHYRRPPRFCLGTRAQSVF